MLNMSLLRNLAIYRCIKRNWKRSHVLFFRLCFVLRKKKSLQTLKIDLKKFFKFCFLIIDNCRHH